jgi:hypothetical protein
MTNAAVERFEPTVISDREWASLERRANVLANSTIVPKALQGKPDDLMAIGLAARSFGMDLSPLTVKQFHVIDGAVEPSGQMCLGLINSHGGHHATLSVYSAERAVVTVRDTDSGEVQDFEFTIDDARKAKLLDSWVEQWAQGERGRFKKTYRLTIRGESNPVAPPEWAKKLIDAGDIKTRENWHDFPKDMLAAKAAKRAARFACPEVLFSLPNLRWDAADGEPPAGAGVVDDPTALDDEVTDVEIDDDSARQDPLRDAKGAEPSSGSGGSAPEANLADDWDREALEAKLGVLDPEHRSLAKAAWTEAQLRRIRDPQFTKDDEQRANTILFRIEEQQREAYKARQRRANALLGDLGVKGDDDRHAAIREATGGETESTGHLTSSQIDAVVGWVEKQKAETAAGEKFDEPPVQHELSPEEFS